MAQNFRGFWRRHGRATLQSSFLVVVLVAVLSLQLTPGGVDLNVGEVAPRTIKSPKKVSFVSRIITDAERDRAAASIADVLDFDPAIAGVQHRRLREAIAKIDEMRAGAGSNQQKSDVLAKLPDLTLSADVVRYLVEFDDLSLRAAADEALRLLDEAQRNRLSARDIIAARDALALRVNAALIPAERQVAVDLSAAYLRPNLAVNEAETARTRRLAREVVKPVEITVEQGETILRDGEIVKPTDVEKLAAVGLRSGAFDWIGFTGAATLAVTLVALLAMSVARFLPTVWASPRQLALMYVVLAVAVVAVKLLAPGRPAFAYAIPVAVAPMLVTTLIDARAALTTAIALAVLCGLMVGNQLEFVTMTLVGGAIGAIGVWRGDRVKTFLVSGLLVGVANLAVLLGFRLIAHDLAPPDLALFVLLCFANGLMAAFLALGAVTVLGNLFGVTTMFGLMELAHPTQPLFQRLLHEAPGTYHHSMMIANLAERAAQRIGADALLCRVGAYYHDIGKITRPYFYVENQLDAVNIHDRLDPLTSARIIASHIDDGVKLAKEYGLPQRVIDMIPQHHGVRFIGPFYWQAKKLHPDDPPVEQDYRYAGPKPQTKEAAILMLADGTEAAVRASKDHSPERIDAVITKIFADRIQEGELDECDLTLHDLSLVKRSFLTVLQGVFHPRIEYPEAVKPPASAAHVDANDEAPAPMPGAVAANRVADTEPRPIALSLPETGIATLAVQGFDASASERSAVAVSVNGSTHRRPTSTPSPQGAAAAPGDGPMPLNGHEPTAETGVPLVTVPEEAPTRV